MSSMFPIVNLLINLAGAAVIWLGADRIAAGSSDVGSMIAYLTYLTQILWSVVLATFMVSMIPRASVAGARIQEVLDTPPSVPVADHPVRRTCRSGVASSCADVGFRYPGAEHPVLCDISFTATAGTTTAVVGSTGAGKTTLVHLVPRLFDATSGSVLVDGVDVRDLAPAVLTEAISLVPQRPYLFSGTVASNLQYGKPDATETEMWAALRCAGRGLRAGHAGWARGHHRAGRHPSRAASASGCPIAWALVRRPEIYLRRLVLGPRPGTDARLRAALAPYTWDAAVVIVAQRVSTIMSADQIVVLDDGDLVGLGTHDELLAGCPTYAEIVESQLGEGQAA